MNVEEPQIGLPRNRLPLRLAAVFASGVFAALIAILAYRLIFPGPPQLTQDDLAKSVAQALASATPPPAFSERVYQIIQPSLVLIQTQTPGNNGEIASNLGSGVIINQNGEILTSLHVVAKASDIQVTFADGTQTRAHMTANQAENDIAVLTPNHLPSQVVPATLGNPASMQIGDEAAVVGNPFGLYGSMSVGVISGFDRSFETEETQQQLDGLIQIDAAVNPGNSGGPLLNRDGQVVGIVVGILNPTEQRVFIGIGFAVPINIAVGAAGSPPY